MEDLMTSPENAGRSSGSLLPKACENCRIRKIRCNRHLPCSNCETSGITCKPATKPTEHRPRVLLSANYEKQIDDINERLAGIEDALKRLATTKLATTPLSQADTPSAKSVTSAGASVPPVTFEGASSFTNHALGAGHAAKLKAEGYGGSAEISAALSNLQNVTRTMGSDGHELRLGENPPSRQLPNVQLLPSHFVLAVIREFKNKISAIFLAYGLRDHQMFEKLCQKVYFPTETVSIGTVTTMHGLLLYLLKELMSDPTSTLPKEPDFDENLKLCENNFIQGIETFEVATTPSAENVSALILGMVMAQDEGKSMLCWILTSCAVKQAISMGYHRKSSLKADPWAVAEDKRHAFWTIYTFDKNLALNLGYTPNIQDYDIDIEYYTVSANPGVRPWDESVIAMAELSKLQGMMYEQLYSLSGLAKSTAERANIISNLSSLFQGWHNDWRNLEASKVYQPSFYYLVYAPFDVVYYSLLTTLHRAATTTSSATEITSACYDAAKQSLRSHLRFFPDFTDHQNIHLLVTYVSWTLLYASFTPLIVVFLHAIAASSTEDVQLLRDVHVSLEPVQKLNMQCERVYGICRTFHRFAEAFVARHSIFVGTYNQQDDLVVMPPTNMYGHDHAFDPSSANNFPLEMIGQQGFGTRNDSWDSAEMQGMSIALGNWLGGNQPVMNLWNMDFDISDNMNASGT